MPNFPILSTGQQAVTAAAVPLPNFPAAAGDGLRINLEALKANAASVYYGPAGVTTATGKELAAGATDILFLDNLDQVYVIAAATGSSVSWSITALGD